MAPEPSALNCIREGCKVSETGECLEGLDPSVCRNARTPGDTNLKGQATSAQESLPSATSQDVRPAREIDLPSGRPLTLGDCYDVVSRRETRIVAIVGESNVGKTSLIAGLYDRFQYGTLADFAFAGSRTLPAFEQYSDAARAAVGRNKPETQHTPDGIGLHFFHLALRNGNAPVRDLLLADRPGEHYKEAFRQTQMLVGCEEIQRADVVCLLVNGALLADKETRQSTITRAIHNGRAIAECGYRPCPNVVRVVFTKLDEIREKWNEDAAKEAAAYVLEQLKPRFGPRENVDGLFVAACPYLGETPAGEGLDHLLQAIMANDIQRNTDLTVARKPIREIDRFELCLETQ